ncbi:MAG: Rhodoferax phage, partial [Pseudomonadota bacterium]
MAGRNYIAAIGPSYHLDDRKAAVQTAINCYLEQIEGLGETRVLTQVSAPGLLQYLDLGAEIRGQRDVEGRWFVVAGSTLYEIVAGAAISRGTLASSSGPVGMAHNNTQLVIVSGTAGQIFTLTSNVLGTITSPGWRGSYIVYFIDGYMIFVVPGTDQFYITALDDASTLDALDFSSADAQPDNIVTALVQHRELILMGAYSTEIWINSGGAMFPFARYNSAQIDIGCVGQGAAVVATESIFW